MELTEGQFEIMRAEGHLLVTGGPGSGKTTISILKAAQIASRNLLPGQKVLFLSFARATVSRVLEAIEYEQKIAREQKKLISVYTYHSFFWRILKTYGYLVGLPRKITALTPPNEAIALSEVRFTFPSRNISQEQRIQKKNAIATEQKRLANENGEVCFDLYAPKVYEILKGSKRICQLIANRYPAIILDEFQDTNEAQWSVIKELGSYTKLLALADPEQRIYDWIGADPARLEQFCDSFKPVNVDLGFDNHRNGRTEIAIFGRDILSGNFQKSSYNGIVIDCFPPTYNPAMTKLVTTVYRARKRLIDQCGTSWSLAILVPTKKMTRIVSDALHSPPAGLTPIHHSAVIEVEAVVLGAEVLALLMQPAIDENHFDEFVTLMCNYYQGKGGAKPTQGALEEAAKIRKNYEEMRILLGKGRSPRANAIITKIYEVYKQVCALSLIGNPDVDWSLIRDTLETGACPRLKEIALEVRNLRLLQRGTQFRQGLAQDWRNNEAYCNALAITRQIFTQLYFDMGIKPESGVVIMNMHKAKGKQFDEVIIFEGWPRKSKGQILSNLDRIVHSNSIDLVNEQTRQNFMVSITRSKQQTTILTPKNDRCVLL